jgi:hypothetical protein
MPDARLQRTRESYKRALGPKLTLAQLDDVLGAYYKSCEKSLTEAIRNHDVTISVGPAMAICKRGSGFPY